MSSSTKEEDSKEEVVEEEKQEEETNKISHFSVSISQIREERSELATYTNDNGVPKSATYGTQVPNDPLTWDARMIKGCVCNDGWSGIDCAMRDCPSGDNPDTAGVNEIQKVS